MQWETVIGLEIHAQLATQSKIFSGSSTAFGAAPNTRASLVDLAMPGTLPVLNEEAVRMACLFGLAIDARIDRQNVFARKNYFYPRPAEGLPDQPDGPSHRRQGSSRHHPGRRHHQAHRHHPRAPGGGRRQEPARRLPGHERHRPEPRRHAVAGDRFRAGHPQRQGSRGLRQGDPRPGALPGHLRRQHGRGLAALRLQRLGTTEGPGRIRHPRRDQERQLLPLHREGDQPRDSAPDRG